MQNKKLNPNQHYSHDTPHHNEKLREINKGDYAPVINRGKENEDDQENHEHLEKNKDYLNDETLRNKNEKDYEKVPVEQEKFNKKLNKRMNKKEKEKCRMSSLNNPLLKAKF